MMDEKKMKDKMKSLNKSLFGGNNQKREELQTLHMNSSQGFKMPKLNNRLKINSIANLKN